MEPIASLRADRSTWSDGSFPGAETGKDVDRRQHGVPLVCLPGGEMLSDSWAVLEHYVAAIDPGWKQRLDHEIGPASRRIGYRALLEPTRPELKARMMQGFTEAEQAFFERAEPIVMATVTDLMGLSDAREAEDREHLAAFFDELSRDASAWPSPEAGAEGRAWWIATSSLASLALMPPEYAGGAWEGPPIDKLDEDRAHWVRAMRATPLGAAVMRFYAEYRGGQGRGGPQR